MTKHELKLETKWFDAVVNGFKNFEVRKNDRDYKVGDTLLLQEIISADGKREYTPRSLYTVITFIITHEEFPDGINEGYCVLGIRLGDASDAY